MLSQRVLLQHSLKFKGCLALERRWYDNCFGSPWSAVKHAPRMATMTFPNEKASTPALEAGKRDDEIEQVCYFPSDRHPYNGHRC